MKSYFKQYIGIAEGFSKLLNPFAEVVIHNLGTGLIEAIFNPFSRRVVGDNSYLESIDISTDIEYNTIGPYEKINYDGP